MNENYTPTFILASASPRRKELLEQAGYIFKVIPAHIDESAFPTKGVTSENFAQKLALQKALAIANRFPHDIVLGADTVVDFHGEIIGKPDDARHAEEITKKLFSGTHTVVTALAIVRISDNTRIVESDVTTVHPVILNPQQIAEHIKSGSWKGRAGAYGIRESGDKFVKKIEGSYTNVVGMPMELFKKMLNKIPQN